MVLQLASAKKLKKKRLLRDTKKRLGLPYQKISSFYQIIWLFMTKKNKKRFEFFRNINTISY
jgi:predicted solute-binding protein